MNKNSQDHRAILMGVAHRVMLERGLLPDFSNEVIAELSQLRAPAPDHGQPVDGALEIRDLRGLLWASIDNDDSRDLDQLTVAETLPDGKVKILVAIADVVSLVRDGRAIDEHARHNTTSVYTAAMIFPMLPEQLSTDLTSLNLDQDRLAVVVEMSVGEDGSLQGSQVYQAWVRNRAKLAYNAVAAWLGSAGATLTAIPDLDQNLRLQDTTAQRMKQLRHVHGALSLETVEARPVFDGDQIGALEVEEKNRAKEIIEEFMIAANGVTARYLSAKNYPSIRRVVRTPKRWDRIVEVAQEHKYTLPATPLSGALEEFLVAQRTADPVGFPDLSLAIIKLLGPGEYVAEPPGGTSEGHFGLAVRDYAHSTAPNRRYPDLFTQRLLRAAVAGQTFPYSQLELELLAAHCTQAEDAANKVERQVAKSAAALLLQNRLGEQFDALVTGAADKGTWVRLLSLPVEGKLIEGAEGVDVGQHLRVQLTATDVERGYIDFKRVGSSRHA